MTTRPTPRWTMLVIVAIAALGVLSLFLRTERHGQHAAPQQAEVVPANVPVLKPLRGPRRLREVANRAPDGATLEVRVRNEGEQPIAAARVWILAGASDALLLGATGADGTLHVAVDDQVSGERLRIRAAGYQPREIAYAVPAVGTKRVVEVALRPAAQIRGRVVLEADRRIGRPATVVAWPTDEGWPSLASARTWLAGHPRALRAQADADGYFELDELEPDTGYSLSAAGAGYVGASAAEDVQAPRDDVVLPVRALYLIHVDVRDETGAALPPLTTFTTYPSPGFNIAGVEGIGHLDTFDFAPLQADAAVPAAWLDDAWTRAKQRSLWLTSGRDEERLGPFLCSFHHPGYLPARIRVWALRADGVLRSNRVTLRRADARERGTLQLFVDTSGLDPKLLLASSDRTQAQDEPFVFVRLRPMEKSRDEVRILEGPMWRPSERPLVVAGLLPGAYYAEVTTLSPLGFQGVSVTRLEVREGETTAYRLPLPPCGSLDVHLLDAKGAPQTGRIVLSIAPKDDEAGVAEEYVVRSGTLRLDGIEPGRYAIAARREDERSILGEVDVRAGALARLELRVGE